MALSQLSFPLVDKGRTMNSYVFYVDIFKHWFPHSKVVTKKVTIKAWDFPIAWKAVADKFGASAISMCWKVWPYE